MSVFGDRVFKDVIKLVIRIHLPMPEMQETQVQSLGWEDPLEEARQPTPVFFPGEFHGQGSLVGCSLWDHKESDLWTHSIHALENAGEKDTPDLAA